MMKKITDLSQLLDICRNVQNNANIYVVGAGKYGVATGEILNKQGVKWKGFIDKKRKGEEELGKKVFSYIEARDSTGFYIFSSFGNYRNMLDDFTTSEIFVNEMNSVVLGEDISDYIFPRLKSYINKKVEGKTKIGILYICVGKYDVFWEEFYRRCERFVLTNYEKHYYVFTDTEILFDESRNSRIHKIYQEDLGWPLNTLFRFEMFWNARDLFIDMDYLFFLNANLMAIQMVDDCILPFSNELVVAGHPMVYGRECDIIRDYKFERNPNSTAYIPFGKGECYAVGGFNGGNKIEYLKFIYELKNSIEKDYSNGIMAISYDESHINKYIYEHKRYKLLHPGYLWPQSLNHERFKKFFIQLDKRIYGGFDAFRMNNGNAEDLLEWKRDIKEKIKADLINIEINANS